MRSSPMEVSPEHPTTKKRENPSPEEVASELLEYSPRDELHFRISDEAPRCVLILRHPGHSSPYPIAYKISSSSKRRYMIWPRVGVISPCNFETISIVITPAEREQLHQSFDALGAAAEFRQCDRFAIESVPVTNEYKKELTGDPDEDLESLLSMWNAAKQEEEMTIGVHRLRVRLSSSKGKDASEQHTVTTASISSSLGPSQQTYTSPSQRNRKKRQQKEYQQQQHNDNNNRKSPMGRQYNGRTSVTPTQLSEISFETPEFENDYNPEETINSLRRQCDDLIAEQSMLEVQLHKAEQELREERHINEGPNSFIYKWQLMQALQCGACFRPFSSDLTCTAVPISSRACGHTICRACVPAPSFIANTFSCSPMEYVVACPLCSVPNAFDKLNINQSLRAVLALLEGPSRSPTWKDELDDGTASVLTEFRSAGAR